MQSKFERYLVIIYFIIFVLGNSIVGCRMCEVRGEVEKVVLPKVLGGGQDKDQAPLGLGQPKLVHGVSQGVAPFKPSGSQGSDESPRSLLEEDAVAKVPTSSQVKEGSEEPPRSPLEAPTVPKVPTSSQVKKERRQGKGTIKRTQNPTKSTVLRKQDEKVNNKKRNNSKSIIACVGSLLS